MDKNVRLPAGAALLFTFLLALIPAGSAWAQTISVGSDSDLPGAAVTVPVSFSPGGVGVSSLEFTLSGFSGLTYTSATIGGAAAAANKDILANMIAPGQLKVILFALNTTPIGSGVVANINFTIPAGAPPGVIAIKVGGIVASAPDASAVAVAGVNGSVLVLAPADMTAPVISAVASSSVTDKGATITWTTNEASDTQVEYGTSTVYGSSTALNSAKVTSHSQALSGLAADTTYHYRVKSRDAAGNLAVSGDFTFKTAKAPDTTAPVISQVTVSNVTHKSATISWTTDTPADSAVEYRDSVQMRKSGLGELVTKHSLTLNRLMRDTVYRFRVRSKDASGNEAETEEYSFTTSLRGASNLTMPLFAWDPQAELSEGEESMSGLAIANLGNASASVTFTAVGSDGVPIRGPGILNPKTLILEPKTQLATLDMKIFGDGFTGRNPSGWVRLESSSPDIGGFFLNFDTGYRLMDGANLADAPLKNFVFTQVEPSGFTRINVSNPGANYADVVFELVGGDGRVRASESWTIVPYAAGTADVYKSLFAGFDPQPDDYVRVRSSEPLKPFQMMRESSGDNSALAGQDASAGAAVLYSPQYVQGGPWLTTLSVVNLEPRSGIVEFRFFSGEGKQLGETRVVALQAYGKVTVSDPEFFLPIDPAEVLAGYVQIRSDGIRLAGSTVFGDVNGCSFSAALPLIDRLQKRVLFSHAISNEQYFTGIAVLNPNNADATVRLELYNRDGSNAGRTDVSLLPGERKARLLWEFFPQLIGKEFSSGYVQMISSSPVISFSLFGGNNLSILSAVPPQEID